MFEGCLTSFSKNYLKQVIYSSFGSAFNLQLFSNLIFKNFYLLKGSWMGDHALYDQIENLFKHVHE